MSEMLAPPALPRRGGGMRRAAGEAGVIRTNDDAQATKLSCISMGYFKDPILLLLHKSLPSRKPPIINRGTWARHAAIKQVTQDFITACAHAATAAAAGRSNGAQCPEQSTTAAAANESNGGSNGGSSSWQQPVCQVVVLGAGSDSSWFNMCQQGWPLLPAAHFIELDYGEVVSKKARTVLFTPQLLQLLPQGTTAATAPTQAGHAAAAGGATAAKSAEAAAAMPPPPPLLQMPPPPPQQMPAAAAGTAAGTAAAAGAALPSLGLSLRRPAPETDSHSRPSLTWTKPPAVAAAQATEAAATGAGQQSHHQQQPQQPLPQQQQPQQQQQQPPQQQQMPNSPEGPGGSSPRHFCGQQPPAAVVAHVQELAGQQYSLVAADLRDMQQLKAALKRAGFKPHLPTLYLCECVLIYLEPAEAEAVLRTLAAAATEAGAAAIAIFEQTRPNDAFGATMISNLEARGCPLRSVMSVPSPSSQAQRLRDAGWNSAAAADMAAIYYSGSSSSSIGSSSIGSSPLAPAGAAASATAAPSMSQASGAASQAAAAGAAAQAAAGDEGWLRSSWQAERRRIEGLELLDELEEWRLLQEHYCLALGVVGEGPSGWLSAALRLQQLAALTP